MKLTPLEISAKRFKKRLRGFDPAEVIAFLEVVASEMEDLIRENRYLEEELTRKTQELAEYKSREQTLKDTLIMAQKMAQDMKNNMVKEAQVVLSEAELEAEKIIRQAQERAIELEEELRELKNQRTRLIEELRSILNTHLKMLQAVEESARKKDEEDSKLTRISPRARTKE